MSIELEITRIENNRNTIRSKLVELGLATSVDNLDALAESISEIINRGAVSATVKEGDTYTIPAGFHNGSGTVSGVGGGGSYNLQSKGPITPTKKQQSITPDDGYFGLSDVTVGAIPDNYQDVSGVTAVAEDVLTGKLFVTAAGVTTAGTMPNNGAVDKTLDGTTVSYTIPKGFHSGSGTVKIVIETKETVTPTKSAQTITATAGKVLQKVEVGPIPDEYQNVSGVTATSEKVLEGSSIVDASGAVVAGSMPNNGAMEKTIDGLNATSVDIPAGYTSGGTVSLTGDIEAALAAI